MFADTKQGTKGGGRGEQWSEVLVALSRMHWLLLE